MKKMSITVLFLLLLLLCVGLIFASTTCNLLQLSALRQTDTNANTNTDIAGEAIDTFSARGLIATLILTDTGPLTNNTVNIGNKLQTMTTTNKTGMMMTSGITNMTTSTKAKEKVLYALTGDWNLNVDGGKVTEFTANFTMININGTERHSHSVTGFKADNNTNVQLNPSGTTMFDGKIDVKTNGISKWTNVNTTIYIEKLNTIHFILDPKTTDNHFKGQPIYGITNSLVDENGKEMIITKTDR
jgi:hypothetical protein